MPTGRTHDRITIACLPVLGGVSMWLSHSSSLTLSLCTGFLFSGLMFGPDLDIDSLQFKRWGPLKVIWLPYQNSMRHRSWLSHGPIVGTTLRLIYLWLWIVLLGGSIALLLERAGGLPWEIHQTLILAQQQVQPYGQEGLAGLVGLELGAMSHSLSDWITSAFKSMIKPHTAAKVKQNQRNRR